MSALEPGRWGVAVSGGADSVALLRLAADDPRLSLHVIHLDHQTRGADSAGDADFVRQLAGRLALPASVHTRDEIEQQVGQSSLPANPSARYRALRLHLYRQSAASHGLQGVLLAHHADDQAETVLLRLLRGGGYSSLAGMAEQSNVGGVLLRRPLLNVRRDMLRHYLAAIDQGWRQDASNASGDYARNRVRMALANRDNLLPHLLEIAQRCRALMAWVDEAAPTLPDVFGVGVLNALPAVVARASIADWLVRHGVRPGDVSPAHVEAVVELCRDAASAARINVPAGLIVVRRQGMVEALRPVTRRPRDASPTRRPR